MTTPPRSDKRILVPGASSGIGQALAIRIARDGFPVAVHYGTNRAGAQVTTFFLVGKALQRRADSLRQFLSFIISGWSPSQQRFRAAPHDLDPFHLRPLSAAPARPYP